MDALEQLVQLLARLVTDGDISEAQAAAILAYWRTRPSAELARVLPLALADGVGVLEDDDDAPWLPVLLLVGGGYAERTRRLDALQDAHAAEVARLADELDAGRLTVAQWQAATRRANAALLDAARALAGGRVTVQMQRYMARVEREQAAYLQRFADGVSARALVAAAPAAGGAARALPVLLAWTAAYIARRAASYSGRARGVFFAAQEAGAALGPGWVVHYQARDDGSTCSPCRDADGYYLPGQGPLPGEICYGGGACRCVRVPVYDPARYAQLLAGA